MAETVEKEVITRLNVIINLLSRLCIGREQKTTAKEQIELLNEMGLSSGEIGRIIGKESNYVTSNLSRSKRRK